VIIDSRPAPWCLGETAQLERGAVGAAAVAPSVGTSIARPVADRIYGFFGLGLALYFASQGAGRLLWPVLAGFSRLVIASVGGWLPIYWFGGGLTALFGVMALAFVTVR
jgi:MATE family, multidrug efflux pump